MDASTGVSTAGQRPGVQRNLFAAVPRLAARRLAAQWGEAGLPGDPTLWRYACMAWGLLAVLSAIKAYSLPGHHSTYLYFPRAAQHWWANQDLYRTGYQEPDTYRYSPTFAVLATPFGWMSDGCGGAVWAIGSVVLVLAALKRLAQHVFPGSWDAKRLGLLALLALPVSANGIWSGQSNALILALMAFGMVAIAKREWWRAAACLVAPVYIKIWPGLLVMMVLTRWWRPLGARLVIVATGWAALPFLTKPWPIVAGQYAAWYTALTGPLQGRWGGYRDAWTILETLLGDVQPTRYKLLQLITLGLTLAWAWHLQRTVQATGGLLTRLCGVWCLWQLLLGPGTERLTYGIIAPFQAYAVLVSFQQRSYRGLALAAWGITSLFSIGDIEKELLVFYPGAKMLLPMGSILSLLWLLMYEFRWQANPWPALRPRMPGLTEPVT